MSNKNFYKYSIYKSYMTSICFLSFCLILQDKALTMMWKDGLRGMDMPLVKEDYEAIGQYVRHHLGERLVNRPFHDLVLWIDRNQGRGHYCGLEVDLKIFQMYYTPGWL